MTAPQPARRQRGLTLVEAATVTGVVAILVGVSLPSWQELTQRRQVEGAAAQLEIDLYLARSEAVARNETVRIAFSRGEHGSCYVMHAASGGSCQCDGTGAVRCGDGQTPLRSVHFAPGHPVQLSANVGHITIDPTRGTITPTTTLRLTSPVGRIHNVINIMGRVRACSPEGRIPGYRAR